MSKKFKIGIIGAGGIVENSHLPVLKNIEETSVAWVYDKNSERSRLVASMYNVPVISEADVLRSLGDVDICLLTIPYGARKEFLETCASMGKSLYVEKPFARSVKEHEYFCGLYPANKLAIGFQRRYYRIVESLQSIIKSEIFGRLQTISFRQGHFTLKGGSGYLAHKDLAGGGVIIESGIHALDQLLLISGAKSVAIENVKSLHRRGIDYDTVFTSQLDTGTHHVQVTCEISTLRNLQNGVELSFENAVLKCKLSHDAIITVTNKNGEPLEISFAEFQLSGMNSTSVSGSFYIFWTEFIQSIKTGQGNLTLANSSILTTSWIEQIYHSIG